MRKIVRFLKGFLQGREKEKNVATKGITIAILEAALIMCCVTSLALEEISGLQELKPMTICYFFFFCNYKLQRENVFLPIGERITGFFSRYGHVMTVKTWKRIKKKAPSVYKRLTRGEIVDPYELKKFIKGATIKYYIDEGTVNVYLSKRQCLFSCTELCHYDEKEVHGKLILQEA